MKILSLIVPSYNSQKFLDVCIPSFLSPEVLPKLDIIIVNDGSTDATPEVARKYCAQYPDSVRLISQENKGHGGALNTGCAAARGKYLKVIDADDWVITENLPAFIAALEECDSDVVLTHHHTIDISTGEVKSWRSYPQAFGKALTFREIMDDWRGFYRSLTFHGITYRTDFYHQFGHQLLEHVFYEDYEYSTFPCCQARSITPLDLFVYEYRIGDVNQSVSNASRIKRLSHLETVLSRMLELYRENPESAGREYAAMKIQEFLLSYLTTVLLVLPDKKAGRALARQRMALCRTGAPEAHALALHKYQIFCLMNRLHISKAAWDRFLNSSLYHRLRGNHDFA